MLAFVGPYKRDALLALLSLLGVVAADLGIPRLTQRVIDQGINASDMSVIAVTSLLMLVVAVVSALFSIANTILSVRVSQPLCGDIRSAIVRKVQTFSFGNLDELETGKLLVLDTWSSIVSISLTCRGCRSSKI